MVGPFLPDDAKIAAIRDGLPATAAGIYLNTGTAGPLPREVALAMAEIADWELTTGRAHPSIYPETLQRMAEARAAMAAVLATDVDLVALTHSTTDGMNIGSWAVDWRAGDRAVTTSLEHPGGLGPLCTIRDRLGMDLAIVDIGDGGDADAIVAAFERAVTPRTRLVSLSHVTWATGALLPIARIAAVAHAQGALVLLDAAQSAGAIPLDLEALDVDVVALPGQKWLLGPEGMGALWVRRSVLGRLGRSFAGWFSFESSDMWGHAAPWADARRFEAGDFHRPSIVGLARSCGWLSMYIGLDWIHRRGTTLARRAADALAAIPGVSMLTPRHAMGTLVTFRIAGWTSEAALDELGARVFAIARAIPGLDALRISVGFFSTEAELDRFVEAVDLLARHTPETLPARRTLTILAGDG